MNLPPLPEPDLGSIQVNGKTISLGRSDDQLRAYAEAAVLAERERCARVCESLFDADDDSCQEAEFCAAAIRALK